MFIKKILPCFMCLIIFTLSLVINVQADEVTNEKVYNPLDLVVVVDNSGSMASSDKNRTAPAAVRMLVNMMPATDSRVAVVGFNTKATVLTKDSSGKNSLISLEDFAGVETIRDGVSNMKYNGGTGIGNAIYAATELLREQSSADRTKAIILFTDGVNDFGYNKLAHSECDSNEATAIQWAKQNGCFIYCVGYDYITSSGASSMGTNGEGLVKLQNIAGNTKGKFKAINNISEIEPLLIEFLADVCNLIYRPVATIPGDGKKHECKIPVSPSVIEANIRIAGGDKNAIKNGKINLYDPDGNEVKLTNSGNVRFDTDATAASIKVVMPKQGEWLLVVEDINGDDIHVGLLEHFKMNLTSTLTFPKGNPKGVAYTNDTVGINTKLTYDGVDITEEAVYDAVVSATAVCVSRADPDDKKIVNLTRDGFLFVGEFVVPQDTFYDITVRIDWDTVYREDVLTVKSSNKPLYLKSEMPDVYVNKNKTMTISDIYQYVADDENDEIVASISSISSPDAVDVTLNDDEIIFTGKRMSSSLVTIAFTDSQGNVVEETVRVGINDPVVWIVLAIFVLLCAAIAILVPYYTYLKSLKIKGDLYFTQIEFCETNEDYDAPTIYDFMNGDDYEELEVNPDALYIPMDRFYRKSKSRSIAGLISETKELFKGCEVDTPQYKVNAILLSSTAKTLLYGIEKSKIIGSTNGGSFTVKISKKTPYLVVNKSVKSANVSNNKKVDLVFKFKDSPTSSRNKAYIRLQYYFITPVRDKKNRKR